MFKVIQFISTLWYVEI